MLTSVEVLGITRAAGGLEKGALLCGGSRQEGLVKEVRAELSESIEFEDRVTFRRVIHLFL